MGKYDLIQISKIGLKYDLDLLVASLHFWEGTTNSLHLRCGMLTPTLFDLAAIDGLRPDGDAFNPFATTVNEPFEFSTKRSSYNGFMFDHFVEENKEESDKDHIAFLTFWLSKFVFLYQLSPSGEEIHRYSYSIARETPL